MDIYLRPTIESDYLLTMAWRSNPDLYQGFYQQGKPLKWEEHIAWYLSRNKDWRNFIIMFDDRPVGVVTIGQLDHWSPEIGYYIGETTLWGKGIGKEAVRLALEYIKGCGKDYCHTTILKTNQRSIRLVKSLGFEYMAEARKGELWFRLKF